MVSTLMVIQAVLAVLLILIVLLQFGKGAEVGLMGAADSVMTGSQNNVLTKITIVISVLFFANSVYLAKLQSQKSDKSLLDDETPIATPFNSDATKTNNAADGEARPANKAKEEGAGASKTTNKGNPEQTSPQEEKATQAQEKPAAGN